MSKHLTLIGGVLIASALFGAQAGFAQTAATTSATMPAPYGLFLTTPHPEVKAPPGKPVSFPLKLTNDTEKPARLELAITGLPDGWIYTLKGGEYEVAAAMVAPEDSETLTLTLTPPDSVGLADYALDLTANYAGGKADLPLKVSLADLPDKGISLTPELPGLRGTKTTTFKYKFKVTNGTNADGLFNLAADAPAGFTTTFKHGYGSDEITGVPVKAGATEDVTLEVKPNASVVAGTYPVSVAILSGEDSAQSHVALEVTGSPDLSLEGPQQRLSGEAVAGETKTFPFTVTSSGSADATEIKMVSSPPRDWKVTFDPETLPAMAAGAEQTVNVSITPSEKAIAGDYMITVHAKADGVDESRQFRVTVNTSTVWGIAGLGIIGLAVLVLSLAVMRYGRR